MLFRSNLGDWLLATGIAASVLLLDEARKLGVQVWRKTRGMTWA